MGGLSKERSVQFVCDVMSLLCLVQVLIVLTYALQGRVTEVHNVIFSVFQGDISCKLFVSMVTVSLSVSDFWGFYGYVYIFIVIRRHDARVSE